MKKGFGVGGVTKTNRWFILVVAIIINICIGTNFCWSVYTLPLQALWGWSAPDVSVVFTINSSLVVVGYFIGGWFTDKVGARTGLLVGGILFFIGYAGSSFVTSLPMLYFTYGVLNGVGSSLAFAANIANTQRLFPDKRGLCSSLNAIGFGLGAVIFSPVLAGVIEANGPMQTFLIASIFPAVGIVLSFFIRTPEQGWLPEGFEPIKRSDEEEIKSWTPKEVMTNKMYYLIFVIYFLCGFCGQVFIALGSPIGQQMYGMTPIMAGAYVSIITLGNTAGRLIFGWSSDHIGRYPAYLIMYIFGFTGALVLLLTARTDMYWAYGIAGFCCGAAFGGTASLMPVICADTWGPKHQGVNYGCVFICYSLFSVAAPQIATRVFAASGSYDPVMIGIMCMTATGFIFCLLVRRFLVDRPYEKRKAAKLAAQQKDAA